MMVSTSPSIFIAPDAEPEEVPAAPELNWKVELETVHSVETPPPPPPAIKKAPKELAPPDEPFPPLVPPAPPEPTVIVSLDERLEARMDAWA
jgi:hypothetical protein